MKVIKIILLLTATSFFSSIPFSASTAKDCSEFKILSHEWNTCKLSWETTKTNTDSAKTNQDEKNETAGDENEKGSFFGIFKKIREIGGKNIGQPG